MSIEEFKTVPKLCQLWIKIAKINQTHQDNQNWDKANKNKGFARIPCWSSICNFSLNRFTKPLLSFIVNRTRISLLIEDICEIVSLA
jgi:hypothetical protein